MLLGTLFLYLSLNLSLVLYREWWRPPAAEFSAYRDLVHGTVAVGLACAAAILLAAGVRGTLRTEWAAFAALVYNFGRYAAAPLEVFAQWQLLLPYFWFACCATPDALFSGEILATSWIVHTCAANAKTALLTQSLLVGLAVTRLLTERRPLWSVLAVFNPKESVWRMIKEPWAFASRGDMPTDEFISMVLRRFATIALVLVVQPFHANHAWADYASLAANYISYAGPSPPPLIVDYEPFLDVLRLQWRVSSTYLFTAAWWCLCCLTARASVLLVMVVSPANSAGAANAVNGGQANAAGAANAVNAGLAPVAAIVQQQRNALQGPQIALPEPEEIFARLRRTVRARVQWAYATTLRVEDFARRHTFESLMEAVIMTTTRYHWPRAYIDQVRFVHGVKRRSWLAVSGPSRYEAPELLALCYHRLYRTPVVMLSCAVSIMHRSLCRVIWEDASLLLSTGRLTPRCALRIFLTTALSVALTSCTTRWAMYKVAQDEPYMQLLLARHASGLVMAVIVRPLFALLAAGVCKLARRRQRGGLATTSFFKWDTLSKAFNELGTVLLNIAELYTTGDIAQEMMDPENAFSGEPYWVEQLRGLWDHSVRNRARLALCHAAFHAIRSGIARWRLHSLFGRPGAREVEALEGDECPICYEEMTPASGAVVKTHRCGHFFHEECLARWLLRAETPSCARCTQKLIGPSYVTRTLRALKQGLARAILCVVWLVCSACYWLYVRLKVQERRAWWRQRRRRQRRQRRLAGGPLPAAERAALVEVMLLFGFDEADARRLVELADPYPVLFGAVLERKMAVHVLETQTPFRDIRPSSWQHFIRLSDDAWALADDSEAAAELQQRMQPPALLRLEPPFHRVWDTQQLQRQLQLREAERQRRLLEERDQRLHEEQQRQQQRENVQRVE